MAAVLKWLGEQGPVGLVLLSQVGLYLKFQRHEKGCSARWGGDSEWKRGQTAKTDRIESAVQSLEEHART